MTASYTYDGDPLTRIRRGSGELVQTAELGTVGQSTLTYNDTAGTQEIIGQKDFEANEDDCSITLLHRGFVAGREYYRGLESVGMGREIDITLADLNAMLEFRGLTETDANRTHEETVDERLAWLLGTDAVVGLFADNGRVDSSSFQMDKANYRYGNPRAVLADCAQAAPGFNFHVQDYGAGPELIFRNDNTSTADSISLRLSNVLSDNPWEMGDAVSGTQVFAPYKDFRLRRSPDLVWSKVGYSYAKGTRVRNRAATATAFNGERYGTASNSNIKRAGTADRAADHLLIEQSTEEDVLEGSILVPSSAVNLFPAGFRMQAKLSYVTTEGYGSYQWFRILEVRKKSLLKPAALYELRLKLSPQETAPAPDSCSDLYSNTPTGDHYPLGGSMITSYSNASDGVVYYYRGGIAEPQNPADLAAYIGVWHFPHYGVGGAGSIDYAGNCVGNSINFMTVGPGTWTIQTEIYDVPMTCSISIITPGVGGTFIRDFTSGESVTFTIDDTTSGDCIRVLRIDDQHVSECGHSFGWSTAHWEAA